MIQTNIRHWHNRYHSEQPLPADVHRQWDASLADIDIDDVLDAAVERDEWLLIRRLPLTTRWRIEDGPVQVGAVWRQALAQSLRQVLEHGGPNVVRYRDRRDAVADLLYCAALGDNTRAWAWRQMGLISDAAPSASALLSAVLRTLLAEPPEIWPLLMRLLQADAATGAWTGLMRVLPVAAWQELLHTAPQTRPFALGSPTMPMPTNTVLPVFDTAGVAALLAWVRSQPLLAGRQLEVLSILLAAMSRPVRTSSATAMPMTAEEMLAAARQYIAALVSASTSALRRESPAMPTAKDETADQPDASLTAKPERLAPHDASDHAADELPPLPALPENARWQPTEWAGLLFLLRMLPVSGAFDTLPDVSYMPVFMWRLATRLQIPVTDAAVWAFCGDWQPGAEERNAAPENWTALDVLADLVVADWADWLAIHAADIPEPRLETVCRRPGKIRFESGWIEVHLPLNTTDVRLRRVALDLDPGWLPWLGCVVRICYD